MIAYIDEYGDTNLNTTLVGVTKYYILCAIVIEDGEEQLITKIEQLAEEMFSGGEIKSSNIGNDNKRRIIVLEKLKEIDFYSICLVIDKDLLYSEGLTYRSVFFKFLNGRIYQLLLENYKQIQIMHDEFGKESFMKEFEKYINKRFNGYLFEPYQNCFVKSKRNRIIQLADLIAGSVAKSIDHENKMHRNIAQLLSKNKIYIENWPNRKRKEVKTEDNKTNEDDKLIETISYNTVIDFIDRYKETEDNKIRIQIYFLKYLLNIFDYISTKKYTYTYEIISNLRYFDNNINNYYIRTKVVAPLRDIGIPIASTVQGYKIPCCKDDIINFLSHAKGVIDPMQNRLRILWKKYYMLSLGQIDLRNGYGFPEYINCNDQ